MISVKEILLLKSASRFILFSLDSYDILIQTIEYGVEGDPQV